jgi:acetyl esterase/lipase
VVEAARRARAWWRLGVEGVGVACAAAVLPAVTDAQLPFQALLDRPAPAPGLRETYGPAPQQWGELFVPQGRGPFAVVVLLHGGCWRAQYDLAYMRHAAAAVRDAGLAVWLPEFRRIGDPGGGWPGTFQDAAAATAHVTALAARYPLDTKRVVTAGHSAGGHLALWVASAAGGEAAAEIRPTTPPSVAGAVGIAAITDLAAYAAPSGCGSAVAPLLGGAPADVPARVAAASPVAMRPVGRVWLVTGALDATVPPAQAEAYRRAHPATTVQLAPDAGHFDVVAPWRPAWGPVLEALRTAAGMGASRAPSDAKPGGG